MMGGAMEHPSILQLSRAGFTEAKRLLRWKLGFECSLIACAVGALWCEGAAAYWLSLVALGSQSCAWVSRHRGLSTQGLAERAKRHAMLLDALGSNECSLELTDLRSEFKQTVTVAAAKADAKGYYFSKENPGASRLRDHVLESAFWSKDLYKKAGENALVVVAVLFFAILAAVFFSVAEASSDTRLLLARIMVVLLSSAVMFELLGDGLTWRAASSDANRSFHRAEHADPESEHQRLALFGDYSAATAAAPPIPDRVYKNSENHLNTIWKSYRSSRDNGAAS